MANVLESPPTGFLTLNEARRLPQLKLNGNSIDLSTIHRWAGRGVRGVRLRTKRIGGRVATRVEWVDDFLRLLTGDEEPAGDPVRTLGQRERAAAAAEKELDAAGI